MNINIIFRLIRKARIMLMSNEQYARYIGVKIGGVIT